MNTIVSKDALELLNALLVLKKFQEKVDSGEKTFDDELWAFISAVAQVASEKHVCSKCGNEIQIYVRL